MPSSRSHHTARPSSRQERRPSTSTPAPTTWASPYADIRALTDAEPLWFDRNGVPRYAPVHPSLLGVYDRFAILAEIQCQSCGKRLLIGEGKPKHSLDLVHGEPEFVEHGVEHLARHFFFGDPPRHDCPGAGETMGCIERRIVEVWERENFEWVRHPELEITLYNDDS